MDGWMDGWMDGSMDGWMDGMINDWMDEHCEWYLIYLLDERKKQTSKIEIWTKQGIEQKEWMRKNY